MIIGHETATNRFSCQSEVLSPNGWFCRRGTADTADARMIRRLGNGKAISVIDSRVPQASAAKLQLGGQLGGLLSNLNTLQQSTGCGIEHQNLIARATSQNLTIRRNGHTVWVADFAIF